MAEPQHPISFNGQLHDFQLVELVQAVGIGGSSGALHLTRVDGRQGVIYFQDGAIVWCREFDRQALSLGLVLQQLGLVSAPVLEENFNRNVADPLGELMGQTLVDHGYLTPLQLDDALRTQILWNVREMSLWNEGTYAFVDNEAPPPRTASQTIEMARAAMEIVRYQYEWNELLQFLPDGMHTQLRMGLEPPVNHPLVFPTAMWRVITRVNAFQTPRRIATALAHQEMAMARMLAPLVREGLLYASVGELSIGVPQIVKNSPAHSVDIFALLSRMEQAWRKQRTLGDQLTVLATFINWTMDAMAEALHKSGLTLAQDSLGSLLQREKLNAIPGHRLKVERNHVDVDDLESYLSLLLNKAKRQGKSEDLETAYGVLTAALRAVFVAINMRVESPQDRSYYVAAWTAMFEEFAQTLRTV